MFYIPCVVVLSGPPLHGKTAAAAELTRRSNFQHFDLDLIKAEILVAQAKARGEEYDFSKGTTPDVLAGIYGETVDRGRKALIFEHPVILSGTFSKSEFKTPLLAFMSECVRHNPPAAVRIFRLNVSSFDVIARRIDQRNIEGHPSSIKSREKYERSLTLVSPWPDGVEVIDIDAEPPLDQVVADIESKIADLVIRP